MLRLATNIDQYKEYIKIIQCLIQVVDKKHYLKKTHADGHGNPHYFWDLIKQTLRWYYRYLEVLDDLLEKPLKPKYRKLEMLLILGLVRIDCLNEQDHYIVHHSVEVSKSMGASWAAALVNKVLRSYLRDKERFHDLYQHKQSLMMAHPGWLIRSIKKSWPDDWFNIVLSNQSIPLKWLNVTSNEQKKHLLSKYEQQLTASPLISTALHVHNYEVMNELMVKRDYWGYIQDISAQMLHLVLKQLPKPRNVLDACAAPGGKTFILLRDYKDIHLTCADVDLSRIEVLKENIARFSETKDLTIIQKDWVCDGFVATQSYDLIVMDAPCSGSGTIKRHPEKKFNPWDLNALVSIQKTMLKNLWQCLKPGGYLVYATCSLLRDENALQIASFLSEQKDGVSVDIELPVGSEDVYGWQILPNAEMDGHYFAVLKKLG